MTEHHELTNVRPIPPRDAQCGWCLRPLHEVPDLTEIITPRRGGPTFCHDMCWSEWVVNDKPAPDQDVPFIINAHQPRAARAPRTTPPKTVAEINRMGHKSVARQTGEAAANVVGFVLWMVVVSTVAMILLAILS